jgi:hypothetical protein
VKKLILLTMLFLIVSSSLLSAIDIVECYNEIPAEFLWGIKIRLTQKNNKWFYNDGMSREDVEALVDKENYYLKLDLPGGGCSVTQEIAIFLTKFNYYIVAINLIGSSMVGTCSYLKFYKYNGGDWTDITADIFPLSDIAPFFDKTYFKEISVKINNAADVFCMVYKLPQYGTKVIAYLQSIDIYELEADDYDEKKELYEQFRNNEKYTSIEIAYDYNNARFYISKKN